MSNNNRIRAIASACIVGICLLAPTAFFAFEAQEESSQSTRKKPAGDAQQKPLAQKPAGTMVSLAVEPAEIRVGDRVTLTVRMSRGEDVGHVPFHLRFDPAVLQFERGDEGSFLRGDGHQTAFFAAAQSTGETVVVGLSRLGREPGVAGAGDLCTLEFTAVGSGDANISFNRASVRDSTNRIVDATFRPKRVVVR